jgi:anti-sigma regulatory factor (Ser/Thr protein kinase)
VTVETHCIDAAVGEHVVQFYENDAQLVAGVGPYLAAALHAGDVAIAIATEAHREAFETYLRNEGIDLDEARAEEQLILLDAASTLASLTSAGEIREQAFRAVIGGLVRRSVESGRLVHAYGEMVSLLWDAGDVLAAIELERLWNDLGRELPFSLYCAYPSASVADAEHADRLHQICHLHSQVLDVPAGEARTHARVLEASFPATREAPGDARRLLVGALSRQGCERASVEAAALVLSELASNAVRHVGSPFSVSATIEHSILRVAVEDIGSPSAHGAMPVRRTRGLGVVDTMALRWGVGDARPGKTVWAELPLASATNGAGGARAAEAGRGR